MIKQVFVNDKVSRSDRQVFVNDKVSRSDRLNA